MDNVGYRIGPSARQTLAGGLLVFAAAAGFGTLAIFGKLAYAVGLSTSTLLLFRFIVATSVIWAVFGFLGQANPLSGRMLWIALAVGTLYAIMTGLFFWGLEYLPAGLAAIVFYTYPAHVFVISTVVLDERLTRLKTLALTVAIVGVVLIVGANPTNSNPVGIGLILLAAIGYAAYITASRETLTTLDSATLTANAMIATSVSMVPFGVLFGHLSVPKGTEQWLIVFGIGLVGTAVPIVLFIQGLDRIEASHANIIGTSEPLVTVFLGVVLLGDHVAVVTMAANLRRHRVHRRRTKELVHLRVRATGETDKPAIEGRRDGTTVAHVGTRKAYCFAAGERREFDLYDRGAITPGTTITGPAIIQEPISMVVFHSDQQAELDEFGQILITTEDDE